MRDVTTEEFPELWSQGFCLLLSSDVITVIPSQLCSVTAAARARSAQYCTAVWQLLALLFIVYCRSWYWPAAATLPWNCENPQSGAAGSASRDRETPGWRYSWQPLSLLANFQSFSVHIEVWRILAAHFINCLNNEERILTLYIHGGPQHFTLNDYPEMNRLNILYKVGSWQTSRVILLLHIQSRIL